MKRWFFIPIGLVLFGAITAFATNAIVISSLLPNTTDDANLEYVEIADISCFDVSLSGYVLRDASGKSYVLSGSISAGSHLRIGRPESKITLNNTDEKIELLDASGVLIDQFEYASSTKDVMISTGHYELPVCTDEPDETATGALDESPGSEEFWSWSVSDESENHTWAILDEADDWSTELSEEDSSIETFTASGDLVALTWSTVVPISSGSTMVSNDSVQADTWAETPINVWAISHEAQKLILEDIDGNGRIDRLSIVYAGSLTWTLDASKLTVYSATGGLSSVRIESSTWAVRSLSLSGEILVIDIVEGDIEHPNLDINATTASHLRLKTYAWFGLRLSDGREVEPLTYTRSFHAYSGAFVENRAYVAPVITPVVATPVATPVQYQPTSTYIAPTYPRALSNPYISIQSGLTDAYECKSDPCKANFIFVPKYEYERCSWVFEDGIADPKSVSSCNPKTVEFPSGDHLVKLILFEDGRPDNAASHSIRIFGKKKPVPITWKEVSSGSEQLRQPSSGISLSESLLPTPLSSVLSGFAKIATPFVASEVIRTENPKSKKTNSADSKTPAWKEKGTEKKEPKPKSKAPAKKKAATSAKPKVLANKKSAPEKLEAKQRASQEKPINSPKEFSLADRAMAASWLVLLTATWGYFVGRRGNSSCDGPIAS